MAGDVRECKLNPENVRRLVMPSQFLDLPELKFYLFQQDKPCMPEIGEVQI
jgi:hypothetical protein